MYAEYPDVVSVDDMCEMLRIGKSSAYKLLHEDSIKHLRIGARYIIPKQAIIAYLSSACYNSERQINDGRLR